MIHSASPQSKTGSNCRWILKFWDGRMYVCMYVCMDGWMDGRKEGQKDLRTYETNGQHVQK